MSAAVGVVEVGALGFDGGAHVLVKLALTDLAVGGSVAVSGTHPDLVAELRTWCRQQGHRVLRLEPPPGDGAVAGAVAVVERGPASGARWVGAERAGHHDPARANAIAERPPPAWGLAARGAVVEPGGPTPEFRLDRRVELWTDRAPGLYAQASASQWDPATAVAWDTITGNSKRVESAVVQLMTFLVENEEAALVVPARLLGQIHPHFREIQQVLAVTVADEARHIEVFTRRATISGREPALSTVGGRASLQSLIDEPDYATAMFLLSVMGEGTFLSLLGFLERHGPDVVTRQVAHLARQDEARHVAFAMSHLERHVGIDPAVRSRLASAVERRHRLLQGTAGLNDEVFDALVLLSGGSDTPEAISTGWGRVQRLQQEMAEHRSARLARLGFSPSEAEVISSLHTRNFM